jgi:hydroxymethylpyrimidine pyrophosphatase-like HAD family hydrolase
MIRAIYVDFDGCLAAAAPGATIDLDLVRLVRDVNRRNRLGQPVPFVAINSGRPEPFVEAMAQVFDVKEYCIFENGAGIFRCTGGPIEFELDSRLPATTKFDFAGLAAAVLDRHGMWAQPGKDFNLTYIFEMDDPHKPDVEATIQDFIEERQAPWYIDSGVNFLNVVVAGTSKGTGIDMVMERCGLQAGEIAGIGDSNSDWAFLEKCWYAACPSNGSEELKARVDYVSTFPDTRGTADIIGKILREATPRAST